jgi:6-phosphogluconolactonase
MTSSNQPLLFIGSYAPSTEPGIQAYRFDDSAAAFTVCGSCSGIANPTFLVVHPNRRWLYTVSETTQAANGTVGAVWALRLEAEPFSLQPINHQSSRGDSPCHLKLDNTGRWLIVCNYTTGSAGVLPIQADGSLGDLTDFVQHHGHTPPKPQGAGTPPKPQGAGGPNAERQAGPHAHSAMVTADNRFVVIADLGLDQLVIYRFDAQAGKLHPHSQTAARPGAGPRHMVFHPAGQILYVANELDNTAAAYDYDAAGGILRERQTADLLPPGAPESTAADIHLSASGNRLYASNRGHNSIAVFEVDAAGDLARLGVLSCGGNWPRNFALAPSGRYMLVANQYSDAVSVLPLREGAREIGAPVTSAAMPHAACIQFA